jgi:hypothetical protein
MNSGCTEICNVCGFSFESHSVKHHLDCLAKLLEQNNSKKYTAKKLVNQRWDSS